jgi:8-hydroxy-5-deazaflavin:NADPH oxidoreductase
VSDRSIAILGGTGPEGSGLALRWAQAGETVIIGSRDMQRARQTADKIRSQVGSNANISGMENLAACAATDLIMLTIPFAGHAAFIKQIKPVLRPGIVLIDTTVPLAASVGGRASRTLGVWQGSAAQETAELVPKGVSVVAAFHNVGTEMLHAPGPVDCDIVVCSDDGEASQIVQHLAGKIAGARALDGGRLENSRILEQITALLVGFNIRYKGHSGIRITGLPASAYISS